MSRRPANFTEADAYRAIRAAQRANAGSVEIKPDGTIWIRLSPETTPPEAEGEGKVEPKKKVVL